MGRSLSPGRYHRLPLPEQGAPLEAQFDAFVSVLRVSEGGRRGGKGGAGSWRVGPGFGSVSMEMLGWVWPLEEGEGVRCVSVCVCVCVCVCVYIL